MTSLPSQAAVVLPRTVPRRSTAAVHLASQPPPPPPPPPPTAPPPRPRTAAVAHHTLRLPTRHPPQPAQTPLTPRPRSPPTTPPPRLATIQHMAPSPLPRWEVAIRVTRCMPLLPRTNIIIHLVATCHVQERLNLFFILAHVACFALFLNYATIF